MPLSPLPLPRFYFFALLFTSHRSPLSERLEQANSVRVKKGEGVGAYSDKYGVWKALNNIVCLKIPDHTFYWKGYYIKITRL